MSHTLIALDDEQKETLSGWLHYLIRKMQLQDMQSISIRDVDLGALKNIQEQLLRPKPVKIFMVANTIGSPETICIRNDEIVIDCDQ